MLKKFFVDDKVNFIGLNFIFIVISIGISLILVKSEDISVSGGIILGVFQVFILNIFWLVVEAKFKLDDVYKKLSLNDRIAREFAESELLQTKYLNSLLGDLTFDKNVKKNLKHLKEAHLFITKLKVETYFNEFFIFNSDRNVISDVPSAYFENRIWKRLVNDSLFYYSIQRLTNFQLDYYLENSDRKRTEINTLTNRNGWTSESFCKLFIIDDDYLDNDNKLKKDSGIPNCKYKKMYDYLNEWYRDVNEKKGYKIKVAKLSFSVGYMNDDIGIFGPEFYGIQRKRNDDEKKIMKEDLKIDFYFNVNDTEEKINQFNAFFESDNTILLTNELFQ